LGSTNGTFVNGVPLTEPRLLYPNDLVFIGGFLLHIEGRKITKHDLSASRITSTQITKDIGGKTILKDISLAIYPREFVGLMGPSGCGKSTLMDALNGLRPATSGNVLVNNLDLYRNFDALRRSIGYVPQKDILHEALTVERTLYYAAKIRLPEGTSSQEIQRVIDEVIETVGLSEQRHNPFKQLSGGQQKRLSLGIELITKPSFIFLDEPTSPLDPETTENMMMLFRRLADEGRIVVMVTHKFEKFNEMHHIAMLTKGGRLAFFGPPQESLEYFGCKEPGEIYHVIGKNNPDDLDRAFKSSPQYNRYVVSRIAETEELNRTTGATPLVGAGTQSNERSVGISQWLTLTRRYLEIKLKDKRNSLLLLAQAPLVAILLSLITDDVPNNARTLFITAITAIWFGANNAMREVVSETAIYTRERLVNLKIPSYIFSKFAVLSGIGLIQCLLFIAILVFMKRLNSSDFLQVTLVLYLTSLAGASMGLFFSALVNSTEKAMSILPLILIPQLLLSGFLKPLDDVYVKANKDEKKPASVAEYKQNKLDKERYDKDKEKFDRDKEKFDRDKEKFERDMEEYERAMRNPYQTEMPKKPKQPTPPTHPTPPEFSIDKVSSGLGGASSVASLMVARWTVEGLAHAVSIEDKKARDDLAASMTVAAYQSVFDKETEDDIKSAYRKRVLLDLAVLSLFNALFLALTMWALKRKDVL
jgi:ABC-type multidrug transport system ATPase subunit